MYYNINQYQASLCYTDRKRKTEKQKNSQLKEIKRNQKKLTQKNILSGFVQNPKVYNNKNIKKMQFKIGIKIPNTFKFDMF